MLTDYKFWYIKRDDYGFITEAAIRFFEGDYQNVPKHRSSEIVPTYIRKQKLQSQYLEHLKKPIIKDINGEDAVLYTTKDFGRIKTDEELVLFANKELKKDTSRTPIPEQNV